MKIHAAYNFLRMWLPIKDFNCMICRVDSHANGAILIIAPIIAFLGSRNIAFSPKRLRSGLIIKVPCLPPTNALLTV